MSYFGQQQQQQQPMYQPQQNNPYAGAPPAGGPGWNVPNQGSSPVYSQDAAEGGGMPKNHLGFSDQTIRQQFVRKVFGLVAIMLGTVTIMCAIPWLYREEKNNKLTYPVKDWIRLNGLPLYILSMVAFFVVYLTLLCCDGVRRAYPGNLICTGILTISIGFMTMMITAFHQVEVVILALAITTISCAGIVLFAITTKRDITSLMGFMFIASFVLLMFGFFAIFWTMIFKTKILYMVYAALGTLLFMVYLAIDVQMIMGGKKYELSPEEHILGAILLFMDIIQIFWFILMLLGGNRD